MTGTEKQIAWAEAILNTAMANIENLRRRATIAGTNTLTGEVVRYANWNANYSEESLNEMAKIVEAMRNMPAATVIDRRYILDADKLEAAAIKYTNR